MRFDFNLHWYQSSLTPLMALLLPLSVLFGLIVRVRRWLYFKGIFKTHRFPIPIIVVGNITVGGTGKTPLVIWLAHFLRANGFKPGIVSRGVGGKAKHQPYRVRDNDDAQEVGDEAILLARHSQCPVIIGINRVDAVKDLLHQTDCDIVISDDGLQHYRLARDIEIAVVDGERNVGNGHLLPAGPLREPPSRLQKVDLIVMNGKAQGDACTMLLEPQQFISLSEQQGVALKDFPHKKIHAFAAIGHPQRFFNSLKKAGFELITHIFPDHHLYQSHEFNFDDGLPIVMTEKDAVKCQAFADQRFWYVSTQLKMDERLEKAILEKLGLTLANRLTPRFSTKQVGCDRIM